jgi:hypothetical protein
VECPYLPQTSCPLPPLPWMDPGLWTLGGQEAEALLRKEVYPSRRIPWKPSVKVKEPLPLTPVPRLREGCREQADLDLFPVDRVR